MLAGLSTYCYPVNYKFCVLPFWCWLRTPEPFLTVLIPTLEPLSGTQQMPRNILGVPGDGGNGFLWTPTAFFLLSYGMVRMERQLLTLPAFEVIVKGRQRKQWPQRLWLFYCWESPGELEIETFNIGSGKRQGFRVFLWWVRYQLEYGWN